MCVRFRTSDSRRGAVAILAAVMLIFLLAMVAFAVDIGYLCVVQTQAQAVADAAAIAGARGLPTVGHAASQRAGLCAVEHGKRPGGDVARPPLSCWGRGTRSRSTFTALTGSATSNANAVQVTVNLTAANGNPVNMFFADVLGIKSSDITASAIAG